MPDVIASVPGDDGQRRATIGRRRGSLHADGRLALRALAVEFDRVGDLRYTGGSLFPRWGLLADAETYSAT